MSYSYLGQAAAAATAAPAPTSLPSDVSTSPTELVPLQRHRGWVAVPSYDVREYVKTTVLTAAAAFVAGMSAGALLGNVFGTKIVKANRRFGRHRGSR